RTPAAAHHLLWTLAVVALLALPIASSGLPAWLVRIPVARETSPVQLHTSAAPPQRGGDARRGSACGAGAGHRCAGSIVRARGNTAPHAVRGQRRAGRRLRGRRAPAARASCGRAVRASPVHACVASGDRSRVAPAARRCVGLP